MGKDVPRLPINLTEDATRYRTLDDTDVSAEERLQRGHKNKRKSAQKRYRIFV